MSTIKFKANAYVCSIVDLMNIEKYSDKYYIAKNRKLCYDRNKLFYFLGEPDFIEIINYKMSVGIINYMIYKIIGPLKYNLWKTNKKRIPNKY